MDTEQIAAAECAPDDDLRECSRCGDEVGYLNGRDECLGCEEERAMPGMVCVECDSTILEGTAGHVFRDGRAMCRSCTHDARRSGWDGSESGDRP